MADQEPITKEFLTQFVLGALQQMEARIDQKLDQRFQESEKRLDKRFYEFEQKLDLKLEQLSETFDIKLERMETKLQSAFHGWASPMDMRMRRNTDTVHDLDQRLVLIEERVARLEQQPTQFRQ